MQQSRSERVKVRKSALQSSILVRSFRQFTNLRQTALSETRVELALRNAMESEAELREAEGADERLLALLGLREASPPSQPQTAPVEREQKQGTKGARERRRPGRRAEGRDMTGQEPNGEEQAVG